MSDEPTTDGAETAKKKKSKLVPILVIVNVLVVGGGVAYVLLSGSAGAAQQSPAAAAAEPQGFGPLVEMYPIVANLNEPDSGRYIKVVIHIEATNAESATTVEEGMIPIRDRALVFFTDIHIEDTVGAEKKNELRAKLIELFDETLGSGHIRNVYFAEFVIQ